MVDVVAALIWQDEKFLICQRPENKARALMWEYVGGKVEKGETKQQALARECREELDIEIKVGEKVMEVEHVYPDITIRLTLFEAMLTGKQPKLLEHADMRWITPEEIADYRFCPADEEINRTIRKKYGR